MPHIAYYRNCEPDVSCAQQNFAGYCVFADLRLVLHQDTWLPPDSWSSCIAQQSFTAVFWCLTAVGKTFKKPRRPFEKERLDAELKLVRVHGCLFIRSACRLGLHIRDPSFPNQTACVVGTAEHRHVHSFRGPLIDRPCQPKEVSSPHAWGVSNESGTACVGSCRRHFITCKARRWLGCLLTCSMGPRAQLLLAQRQAHIQPVRPAGCSTHLIALVEPQTSSVCCQHCPAGKSDWVPHTVTGAVNGKKAIAPRMHCSEHVALLRQAAVGLQKWLLCLSWTEPDTPPCCRWESMGCATSGSCGACRWRCPR